jgi:hypothetical protein
MAEILVGEGQGIEVIDRIRHQGFFFAHYDADLEQCWLADSERFEPGQVTWPERAIILRIMHHIIRVRRIWGEQFVVDEDSIKSKRVYAVSHAELITDRKALKPYARQLRDSDGAQRLLRLGNCAGIIVDPSRKVWAKLRLGEHLYRD